jgi:valyl-tRNA synthetase
MTELPPTELPKAYDPKGVEDHWYAFWDEQGYFRGHTGAPGEPFAIAMPPGNVTGALHMGGALNNITQDVLIRRARMQGRPTLWVPGTDHAAIATQAVLERRLAAEGKTRFDLGREAFEELFWQWKDEYESRILGALKRLGCSADWSRTRFTMDPGLSNAVRTVFVRLFDEGLIYRGARIINWCPKCTSAISDIEVNHEQTEGELITIRYPLTDGDGSISVATTRVETMLGDTGVAVNPDDDRYTHLVGKTVILPLVGREIPIVADAAVDPEFGTGAVKITPAHDANDFEIAERQGLPAVNIFDKTATVNENGGRFEGLDRYAARKAVLDALKAEGVVENEERPYIHAVGYCDRTPDTQIEPWLSEQWFVSMKPLAKPAIDVVRDGKVRFVPESPFERVYLDWMENIRDWCISRQLWLGHRIPAWYCPDGHITVAMDDASACATCGSTEVAQDEDTLDTWFSSALWPFSTLGWPDDTEDLRYWYPTTVLSTAREIIYLWVARMIFTGLHFVGDIPFRDVVIHAVVRAEDGRKMSRSLGNVIDPLEIIDEYGTDALRLWMMLGCNLGQDVSFSRERVEGSRRFCNKLWNASRFALQQLDGVPGPLPDGPALPERWILSRFARTVTIVDDAYAAYDFQKASDAVYHFVWSEFCDWYLEMAKTADEARRPAVQATIHYVLERTLRLAHPMIPFITEEIWQRLPRSEGPASIMIAPWPATDRAHLDDDAERDVELLQSIVVEIRRFRADHRIAPRQRLEIVIADGPATSLILAHAAELRALAAVGDITVGAQPDGWSSAVAGTTEIFLPLGELVDLGAERARLEREIAEEEKRATAAKAKLDNEKFTSGAPADVVEKVRRQLADHSEKAALMRTQLEEFGS